MASISQQSPQSEFCVLQQQVVVFVHRMIIYIFSIFVYVGKM